MSQQTDTIKTNHTSAKESVTKVLKKTFLTTSTYVLRLDKRDMNFIPGQHILLGMPLNNDFREYSVYSGKDEPYIEVLIKEVEKGLLSKQLKNVVEGDEIKYEKPIGYFTIDEQEANNEKFLFISSGTGISPFHSFIKSYPTLNYKLIHGTRHIDENYGVESFNREDFVHCVSRDEGGDYKGRVTDYLKESNLDTSRNVYLCGNYDMILDSIDILKEKGFSDTQIFTEVYF